MSYLNTTIDVYKEAAENPQVGLCCTTTPVWQLPGLSIPQCMLEMNYGCGSTVNPRDLVNNPKILYVGVGGGMELLQFAYFSRQSDGVIGIDIVDEMLTASKANFTEAEKVNPWFKSEFIELRRGDALQLPVDDNSIDVAAQNCLFNIFHFACMCKNFIFAFWNFFVYEMLWKNHFVLWNCCQVKIRFVCLKCNSVFLPISTVLD